MAGPNAALPVYVINLDRAPERWAEARRQLEGRRRPFERVPAVDGAAFTCAELDAVRGRKPALFRWLRDLSPAEVGCYLSHRRLWQRIAAADAPGAVVLEDDFVLDADWDDVLDALAARSAAASMAAPVLVRLQLPGSVRFRRWAALGRDAGPLTGRRRLVRPCFVQWECMAYYVSRAGAARLAERSGNIHRPVDDVIRRTWDTGVAVYNVEPAPVRGRGETSSIGQSRRPRQRSQGRLYYLAYRTEFALRSLVRFAADRGAAGGRIGPWSR